MLVAAAIVSAHFEVRNGYQVWVPEGYDAAKRWPAILFLHGAGERGDDNVKQTTIGLGPLLRAGKVSPPAVVVFPQCPEGSNWTASKQRALDALDEAEREFSIDPHRVSLTGGSMGGAGVWSVAAAAPRRFSALAPICGWVHLPASVTELRDPVAATFADLAARLPNIPIWIFHGTADPVVPVSESRGMAGVLGANAAYTEFAGVKHNAWDPAYTTTHVLEWLTKQKR